MGAHSPRRLRAPRTLFTFTFSEPLFSVIQTLVLLVPGTRRTLTTKLAYHSPRGLRATHTLFNFTEPYSSFIHTLVLLGPGTRRTESRVLLSRRPFIIIPSEVYFAVTS